MAWRASRGIPGPAPATIMVIAARVMLTEWLMIPILGPASLASLYWLRPFSKLGFSGFCSVDERMPAAAIYSLWRIQKAEIRRTLSKNGRIGAGEDCLRRIDSIF